VQLDGCNKQICFKRTYCLHLQDILLSRKHRIFFCPENRGVKIIRRFVTTRIYQTTRRHIMEYCHLHIHNCENLNLTLFNWLQNVNTINSTPPKEKVKWSRYRPGVAQRVGRGITLLFHDRGTRRRVSGQQHARAALYPPGKTRRYPFYRSLGGPPGPVWTGGKSRPHRDSIPDSPARSQSLYRLSYRAHTTINLLFLKQRGQ